MVILRTAHLNCCLGEMAAPPVASGLLGPCATQSNMVTKLNFLVPLGCKNRQERIAFAVQQRVGIEVTAFVGGPALNDHEVREQVETQLSAELATFEGTKTMHGAFLDLALHSQDGRVAAVSQSRIERDLLTAQHLGCEKIVFHLGFNPLVPGTRYQRALVEAHAEFWWYALSTYPGITICLENVWEPDWTVFGELFEAVQHPRFGLCLDVAHAHVHSHYNPEAWIRSMATQILHLHWTDNCGDRDSHLPLGAGNINWPAVFEACRAWKETTVTLEMNATGALRRSLAFLRRQGAFPPADQPREATAASALTPP